MAKKTHDVVATVGEYEDRQSGEKKKRYLTVGAGFTDDQGRLSIKLEAVPVGPAWSGWLSLYPADKGEGGNRQQQSSTQQSSRPAQQRQAPRQEQATLPVDASEEDIPF